MSHLVAPSLLAADFLHLNKEIEMVNQSSADWLHFDVMDGKFVPNISFGITVLESIKPACNKPVDVHLMMEDPESYLEAFHAAGADVLTVHVEACRHLDSSLRRIRSMGMLAGVALNPATPISSIQHILPIADLVLIMSVNPGFGGQSFLPYVLKKAAQLKQWIQEIGSQTLIEMDGGIDQSTAPQALAHGVDILVAGSYVFGNENPPEAIQSLKSIRIGSRWT